MRRYVTKLRLFHKGAEATQAALAEAHALVAARVDRPETHGQQPAAAAAAAGAAEGSAAAAAAGEPQPLQAAAGAAAAAQPS